MKARFKTLTFIGTALTIAATTSAAFAQSSGTTGENELKLDKPTMERLCREFPLNSRCQGTQPSSTTPSQMSEPSGSSPSQMTEPGSDMSSPTDSNMNSPTDSNMSSPTDSNMNSPTDHNTPDGAAR